MSDGEAKKKYRLTLTTEVTLSGRFADVDRGWIRTMVAKEINSYVPRKGMEFGPTIVGRVETLEVKDDEPADDEG